jgi:uncharacterized membrane protein
MDTETLIAIISRWVHVGTAIVILGGSVFMRFVLMPAAAQLPEDQHQALRERMMSRWRKFIMIGIALFLLSGFYNYIAVAIPAHKGDGRYHMLMGIKILIAFAVFFLASALVGRSKGLEPIRQNSRRWLLINILLASATVAIGGYLKVALKGTTPAAEPAVAAPEAAGEQDAP